MTVTGVIAPWTGRFYSLWDTDYAKIHIPIIASVSEHQPTAWPSFFFDTSFLIWLFPAGVYLVIQELRDEHVFIIIYSILGSYFAGVMVRLMLTLTPVICITGAIAISSLFDLYGDFTEYVKFSDDSNEATDDVSKTVNTSTKGKSFFSSINTNGLIKPILAKFLVLLTFVGYMFLFVTHCTWVTSNAYSSPSVVLASSKLDGSMFLIDDFREASTGFA